MKLIDRTPRDLKPEERPSDASILAAVKDHFELSGWEFGCEGRPCSCVYCDILKRAMRLDEMDRYVASRP